MKGRASRAVYMRLQPSLLSPPSDPEEREKKGAKKKKKGEQKKTAPWSNPRLRRLRPRVKGGVNAQRILELQSGWLKGMSFLSRSRASQ